MRGLAGPLPSASPRGASPRVAPPFPPPLITAGGAGGDALALAHLVRESVAAGAEREALHVRLSRLGPQLRQGHHRRLVQEALAPVLRPARSRLFELPNGDLVAISPPQGEHLRNAQRTLATLFGTEADEPSSTVLLQLPRDAVALLAAVEDALGRPLDPLPPAALTGAEARFDPADLAVLERALRGASIARFLRRRPICRLTPGGEAELVWEEWRLAWPELLAALLPGPDPAAAPWLRRRLRRILERRQLAELADPAEARRRGPIGLCLAAATLGEEEFLRLDALLGASQRQRTVIALPIEDLLADAGEFAFARAFAQARGYQVALDVAQASHLALLAPARLADDLIRLSWSPDLPALTAPLPRLPERVVLTGADRAAAIGWGWEMGITLFEGRLLNIP